MAEFKIARIRFRWRGEWQASTIYAKDDIVRYGARVYVSLIPHTSNANFYNDLNAADPKWTLNNTGASWTGNWTVSTFYKIDDLAKLGSVIYKCIEAHTSNATVALGLSGQESNWTIFAEGENWRGSWTPSTTYEYGDLVKYGGKLYICQAYHISAGVVDGLELDLPNWLVYTRSLDWLTDWTPEYRYKPDDLARYGGIVYRCITGHVAKTSNSFSNPTYTSNTVAGTGINFIITKDGANYYAKFNSLGTGWLASESITVAGALIGGTTPGNNCVITVLSVGVGGTIATYSVTGTAFVSADGLEADTLKWEIVISGIEYKGNYTQYTRYKKNDIVKYGGSSLWICNDPSDAGVFASSTIMDETKFSVWLPGLGFEDVWLETTYYQPGDVVMYGGYSYVCLISNINQTPEVETDSSSAWELLIPGYKLQGDWASTTSYKTGDVVRSGGNLYIAVTDNLSVVPVETTAYDPGTFTPYPWQLLVTGKRWRGPWYEIEPFTVNTIRQYYPGDVVTVAGTTYACILYHSASVSAAKPTLDMLSLATDYWVKIAQGIETNVLEVPGDIKTINDDSTFLRIPIGNSGQSLQITDNLPDWKNAELISKIFYVSIEGIDSLTRGTTIQTPFRTIKFALDFVNADKPARTPCTVFVKTGLYEEILPMNVPYDTALCGDELRSVVVRPADGYEGEDMFRVNNGSGIRNMTLQGLYGTLGPANAFLTKRPSGGAFVSLNPGNSPSDATAWITNKSPYIQNVTTFGTGCIGMKIDGDLHNGGNKSIVANDFTQVLSDGIGFWVNGDGRSELVSVFTYYCHIGYLATDGGRVRATNGNNSYGDFGSVAEGFSLVETPITAEVDNRTGEATIRTVYNDENQIFAFGYTHTGQDYSSATVTITGSGAGAAATFGNENTRYQSISEVRFTDPLDSGFVGGLNYTSIEGNARGGDDTSVLLANQYEPEYEKSFTATTGGGVNTLTIQNTIFMQVNDAIIFIGTTFGNINANTIYYVKEIVTSNTIKVSTTLGGAAVSLTTASGSADLVSAEIVGQKLQILEGTGRGQFAIISYYDHTLKSVNVKRQFDNVNGFEHLLGGLAIEPVLDQSTRYIIEPSLNFSDPPYSASTVSVGASAVYTAIGSARLSSTNVTVILSNTGGRYTTNGTTWNACSGLAPVPYFKIASSTIRMMAISPSAISTSTDGITWTGASNPGGYGAFTSVAAVGTVFIVTTAQGYVLRTSDNGSTWAAYQAAVYDGSTVALSHAAGGAGIFIVCSNAGQTYESVNLGETFIPGPTIGGVSYAIHDLIYGNNRFVAAANDAPGDSSTVANRFYYTLANEATLNASTTTVWQPSELPPSADRYWLSYSQGVFVAITEDGELAESIDAKHWKLLGSTIPPGGVDSYTQIVGASLPGPRFIPIIDGNTNTVRVITYGARAVGRAIIRSGRFSFVELLEPGSGYSSTPTLTIVDNSKTVEAQFTIRTNNGTLSQPTFTNRGTGFLNVSATITGDGLKDQYQTGKTIRIKNLSRLPGPGDNIYFDNIADQIFKLNNFTQLGGVEPNLFGTLQFSPGLDTFNSPDHLESIVIRQNYSQVRLTGHDFLDIGTGNTTTTNYPELYVTGFTSGYEPQPFNEVVESGGGRVFYTSTDQNGNFRVGEQFEVEQSTGIVTLNADFFSLEGLTELSLGGVVLGGSQTVINEFSKDPLMTANSDNIIPTQKAVVSYIQSRISGGGSNLNVSTLRAGAIEISNDDIVHVGDETISIKDAVNFQQGIKGAPLALNYFLGGSSDSTLEVENT